MGKTKVSVIIPVYNVEEYLKECLDSVIGQTLADIEIICVNDGSTDGSGAILEEYAARDKRIKVINQENKGAGEARNEGLKAAKGEFVAFLDPDDYYQFPDNLEALYNNAIEHNVQICGGSFSHLYNGEITVGAIDNTYFGYDFKEDKIINYNDWQFDYGYHRFLYDRNFLISNGILFPSYSRFQDPPFFVQAMYKAQRFYALKRSTYLLRVGHRKVKWTDKKIVDMLSGIEDNLKFAKEHSLKVLLQLSYIRLKQHIGELKDSKISAYIFLKILLILLKYNPKPSKEVGLERYSWFSFVAQSMFSIRNNQERTHKVICIFGVKLKLRKK